MLPPEAAAAFQGAGPLQDKVDLGAPLDIQRIEAAGIIVLCDSGRDARVLKADSGLHANDCKVVPRLRGPRYGDRAGVRYERFIVIVTLYLPVRTQVAAFCVF